MISTRAIVTHHPVRMIVPLLERPAFFILSG